MNPITVVVGTRPEIIKMAPLIRALQRNSLPFIFVHCGQHYDYEMTKMFFEEPHLPDLTANLNVGTGTHAQQTSRIMLRLKNVAKTKTDLVIVPDDSALKGTLVNMKNL
jgi:UDP-N-acetylglucosamine 2-epimerase (non-hydrolysing)